MSLSDVDRQLLQRCLDREPRAWQDFVDRFVGLVVHVVNRTAMGRGLSMDEATRDDMVAEVFLVYVRHDFAVLRRFRRQCSLATYLTIVARRVVVRRLTANSAVPGNHTSASSAGSSLGSGNLANGNTVNGATNGHATPTQVNGELQRIENAEEVEHLMLRLDPREASVVRMYHLEGKSYQEISQAVGLSENTIGPLLHRARAKMGRG
ncbi:MAG: sigma-70 family RNA polymerase sigma factor [Rhodopirellula sp.]|uniref:RNA polymerase sigma-E factor-like protein n=1 Tax=Rhodopirellula europaea SH398 TaxID=1263868 RepID=M5S8L8_9BACT|nr:sigma-70 family RNA polymerase sigma factor [Rhodopirellula europaea]EMI27988.1 RNA polymerase sigma-E factor-like protein [Rhodopirellula europaea SH398]MAP07994.1 sigma-70 family RNA polymerase sigma factor [Rhodopirellula sp.]MCR9211296.1 sigma-70 family RNA polymerase sigma factor [bacterium]